MSEDIAEKLASELAQLMGVPAARVELASRDGVRGALVEDARGPGWELQHGQALLPEVVPDYDPSDAQERGYNVHTIQQALERFAAPPMFDLPKHFRAFDVFAGYLVFDALIAHGDRHDRNWAVILPPPDHAEPVALCASFDHAASLGFTLTDTKRIHYLDTNTVAEWAGRGLARRFEHRSNRPRQTLVDLAVKALDLCDPHTREYWREQILSTTSDSVLQLVAAAPGLSEVALRFTLELIMVNRRRLLDVLY